MMVAGAIEAGMGVVFSISPAPLYGVLCGAWQVRGAFPLQSFFSAKATQVNATVSGLVDIYNRTQPSADVSASVKHWCAHVAGCACLHLTPSFLFRWACQLSHICAVKEICESSGVLWASGHARLSGHAPMLRMPCPVSACRSILNNATKAGTLASGAAGQCI